MVKVSYHSLLFNILDKVSVSLLTTLTMLVKIMIVYNSDLKEFCMNYPIKLLHDGVHKHFLQRFELKMRIIIGHHCN